ncbi:hypothetical protein EON65_50465 [archaeon]|nr:MAG: hypothetical protein EON65_50465 [archaeon]
MTKVLIKNASVWQWSKSSAFDGFAMDNGFVYIENGFIKKVSDDVNELLSIEANVNQVINANGALMLPGLIGN